MTAHDFALTSLDELLTLDAACNMKLSHFLLCCERIAYHDEYTVLDAARHARYVRMRVTMRKHQHTSQFMRHAKQNRHVLSHTACAFFTNDTRSYQQKLHTQQRDVQLARESVCATCHDTRDAIIASFIESYASE